MKDLGPKEFVVSSGTRVLRTDLDIESTNGHTMKCSHFEPLESKREWKNMPCVIYMHGNSSCRVEALELVARRLVSHAHASAVVRAALDETMVDLRPAAIPRRHRHRPRAATDRPTPRLPSPKG